MVAGRPAEERPGQRFSHRQVQWPLGAWCIVCSIEPNLKVLREVSMPVERGRLRVSVLLPASTTEERTFIYFSIIGSHIRFYLGEMDDLA